MSKKLKSTSLFRLMFFESSEESRQVDTEDRSPDSRVTSALDELDIPYRYLPFSRTFEAHLHLEYVATMPTLKEISEKIPCGVAVPATGEFQDFLHESPSTRD
jgi:hypothetical protein